jgi:putative toxin-antitoxin system antitoxin component (TIGR02293 family)
MAAEMQTSRFKAGVRQKHGSPVVVDIPGRGFEVRGGGEHFTLEMTYHAIKFGISAEVVRKLEAINVLEHEDVRAIIPQRTLERRLSRRENLRTEEADGIARLLRIIAHAIRVFENEEHASEWLRSPNPALKNEMPISMAATDIGAREAEGVLTRLEHGVFD